MGFQVNDAVVKRPATLALPDSTRGQAVDSHRLRAVWLIEHHTTNAVAVIFDVPSSTVAVINVDVFCSPVPTKHVKKLGSWAELKCALRWSSLQSLRRSGWLPAW